MNAQAIISDARQKIAETAQNYDLGDFLDGQADCRDGKPHLPERSESYDKGYQCQYELEQIMGEIHG